MKHGKAHFNDSLPAGPPFSLFSPQLALSSDRTIPPLSLPSPPLSPPLTPLPPPSLYRTAHRGFCLRAYRLPGGWGSVYCSSRPSALVIITGWPPAVGRLFGMPLKSRRVPMRCLSSSARRKLPSVFWRCFLEVRRGRHNVLTPAPPSTLPPHLPLPWDLFLSPDPPLFTPRLALEEAINQTHDVCVDYENGTV